MTDRNLPRVGRPLQADGIARVILAGVAAAAVLAVPLRLSGLLIGCAVLAAVRPQAALLVWIALAGIAVVPLYSLRHSAVYFSSAYLTLLVLCAAAGLVLQRRAWRAPALPTIALLALALAAIAAGLHGALAYDPAVPAVHRFALVQVYATALIVLSAAAALLVADQLEDARHAWAVVVGVGAYFIATSIVDVPSLPVPFWKTMIVAQSAALVYALLLTRPPRSFWLRGLCIAFVLYPLAEFVLRPLLERGAPQWISSWLALAVPIAVITCVRFPKLSVFAFAPGAVAALAAVRPAIERTVSRAQAEGDFGRLRIWADAFRLMVMRPLLGVGPGNYSDYIERYAHGHPYGSSHGNYQQVAAEMGIVGLVAFLGVIGTGLWLAWRQYRRAGDPFVRAFALGVLGAFSGQLAAAVVGDYLLPAYHNGGHTNICVTLYVWILLGALMATARQPGSGTTR